MVDIQKDVDDDNVCVRTQSVLTEKKPQHPIPH